MIISLDHERWKRTGKNEALELVTTKSKNILKILKKLEKKNAYENHNTSK